LQARPNGLVIVDFSVVDNPNSGSTIPHRLVAACQIDNAKPAHAKGEVFAHPGTFVIRSTMREGNVHRVNCSQQLISPETTSYADNTAHKAFSFERMESIPDSNTISYTRLLVCCSRRSMIIDRNNSTTLEAVLNSHTP